MRTGASLIDGLHTAVSGELQYCNTTILQYGNAAILQYCSVCNTACGIMRFNAETLDYCTGAIW